MLIAPPGQLIRLAVAAITLAAAAAGGWTVNGWRLGKQIEQTKAERAAQDLAQSEANQEASRRRAVAQRKADDAYEARIRTVGDKLADALVSLRNRPERGEQLPGAPADCVASTGAGLASGDAEFLARYAAEAAEQQAELRRCIGAYEAQRTR
jgi:hypothetical protein